MTGLHFAPFLRFTQDQLCHRYLGAVYRWVDHLKEGIPKPMVAEKAAREKAESGRAAFVPISLKATPVEIELPNGGVVRLLLGVGQVVLVEVIRAVGALRPWKAPKS